jgi:5-methylcytosine-specific restriction protein A
MPDRTQRICPYCKEPGPSPCPCRPKQAAHDRERGSAATRGYGRRWQAFRKRFLNRNPLCECGQLATEVHHLKPRKDFPQLAYVMSNCRAMCKSCHSRETRRGG